jgi:hypothetical protein
MCALTALAIQILWCISDNVASRTLVVFAIAGCLAALISIISFAVGSCTKKIWMLVLENIACWTRHRRAAVHRDAASVEVRSVFAALSFTAQDVGIVSVNVERWTNICGADAPVDTAIVSVCLIAIRFFAKQLICIDLQDLQRWAQVGVTCSSMVAAHGHVQVTACETVATQGSRIRLVNIGGWTSVGTAHPFQTTAFRVVSVHTKDVVTQNT